MTFKVKATLIFIEQKSKNFYAKGFCHDVLYADSPLDRRNQRKSTLKSEENSPKSGGTLFVDRSLTLLKRFLCLKLNLVHFYGSYKMDIVEASSERPYT